MESGTVPIMVRHAHMLPETGMEDQVLYDISFKVIAEKTSRKQAVVLYVAFDWTEKILSLTKMLRIGAGFPKLSVVIL